MLPKPGWKTQYPFGEFLLMFCRQNSIEKKRKICHPSSFLYHNDTQTGDFERRILGSYYFFVFCRKITSRILSWLRSVVIGATIFAATRASNSMSQWDAWCCCSISLVSIKRRRVATQVFFFYHNENPTGIFMVRAKINTQGKTCLPFLTDSGSLLISQDNYAFYRFLVVARWFFLNNTYVK